MSCADDKCEMVRMAIEQFGSTLAFFLIVFFLVGFRFDRDWKKIEAFVGSKTVIQVIL